MVSDMAGLHCIAPLFVPGDRPERFVKAAASGADAIILDLEDAVAPEAKDVARLALAADFTTLPVFVRINAIGTAWHPDDISAVERLPVAGIILPKAEAGHAFDQLVTRHPIIALIETARGLANARQLAANPRISRLAFGSLDYCADLGCAHTREALLLPRSELVLASRLGGKPAPIDGVTAALDDIELAEDDARHAQGLGFGGKFCVHPRQIAAVLRGLRPSAADIAWAKQVIEGGPGVAVIGSTMVDAPVKSRAIAILARSGRA